MTTKLLKFDERMLSLFPAKNSTHTLESLRTLDTSKSKRTLRSYRKSLARLEEAGFVQKIDAGYKITGRGNNRRQSLAAKKRIRSLAKSAQAANAAADAFVDLGEVMREADGVEDAE